MSIRFSLGDVIVIILAIYLTITWQSHPVANSVESLRMLQIAMGGIVSRIAVDVIKYNYPYDKSSTVRWIYYVANVSYIVFFWWSVILMINYIFN